MLSRLEHVLGIDNRCPAPPHAKRVVVAMEPPSGDEPGHCTGCLWIDANYGALYVNIGNADQADWVGIGPTYSFILSAIENAIAAHAAKSTGTTAGTVHPGLRS